MKISKTFRLDPVTCYKLKVLSEKYACSQADLIDKLVVCLSHSQDEFKYDNRTYYFDRLISDLNFRGGR